MPVQQLHVVLIACMISVAVRTFLLTAIWHLAERYPGPGESRDRDRAGRHELPPSTSSHSGRMPRSSVSTGPRHPFAHSRLMRIQISCSTKRCCLSKDEKPRPGSRAYRAGLRSRASNGMFCITVQIEGCPVPRFRGCSPVATIVSWVSRRHVQGLAAHHHRWIR
ncbi:hypothetical protein V8C44DRAFT_237204 [Trichoderma aethiopicum]